MCNAKLHYVLPKSVIALQCLLISQGANAGGAAPSFGTRAPPSRGSSVGSDAGSGGGAFYPAQAPPVAPGGARPMGRVPQFGAQQGQYAQPVGPQVPQYGVPQTQAVLDQFEALTLGPAAPGQPGDAGQVAAVFLFMLVGLCAWQSM